MIQFNAIPISTSFTRRRQQQDKTRKDKQTHSQFALSTPKETRRQTIATIDSKGYDNEQQTKARQGKAKQASSYHLSGSMMTKDVVTWANMFWVRTIIWFQFLWVSTIHSYFVVLRVESSPSSAASCKFYPIKFEESIRKFEWSDRFDSTLLYRTSPPSFGICRCRCRSMCIPYAIEIECNWMGWDRCAVLGLAGCGGLGFVSLFLSHFVLCQLELKFFDHITFFLLHTALNVIIEEGSGRSCDVKYTILCILYSTWKDEAIHWLNECSKFCYMFC